MCIYIHIYIYICMCPYTDDGHIHIFIYTSKYLSILVYTRRRSARNHIDTGDATHLRTI